MLKEVFKCFKKKFKEKSCRALNWRGILPDEINLSAVTPLFKGLFARDWYWNCHTILELTNLGKRKTDTSLEKKSWFFVDDSFLISPFFWNVF